MGKKNKASQLTPHFLVSSYMLYVYLTHTFGIPCSVFGAVFFTSSWAMRLLIELPVQFTQKSVFGG